MLQRSQDRDDTLQPGVDIGMAAGVTTRLGQRLTEMILHNGRQSGLGLDSWSEGRPISPRGRLAKPA